MITGVDCYRNGVGDRRYRAWIQRDDRNKQYSIQTSSLDGITLFMSEVEVSRAHGFFDNPGVYYAELWYDNHTDAFNAAIEHKIKNLETTWVKCNAKG